VLELKFVFYPEKYTPASEWYLNIRSYTDKSEKKDDKKSRKERSNKKVTEKTTSSITYRNPIRQTGVPIFVLIYAKNGENGNYSISVNGGDHIYYPQKFPAWAVNYLC